MVNILVHSVYSPVKSSDDEDDYESTESEQSEILDEKVSPHGHGRQSFLRKWRPSLSKKLIKSFVAVSKIRRNGKNESARMEKLLREMGKEKPIRFSLKQLESFTRNFSSRIGAGGFGSIYKGNLPNGVPVAIKRRQVAYSSSSGDDEFITEVSILGRTYHRYIVRLIGFCAEANVRALVYEYMENGSLDQILFCSNNDHGVVDWEKLYHIAIEVANGITYLHQGCPEMIVHYDIKPSNILLDAKFSAKIADFGLAQISERGISHDTIIKGTHGYLAPELAIRGEGSSRCDVFSFGMMLFEIVQRGRNFNRMDRDWFPKQVWDEFEKGELDKFLVEHDIEEEYKEQAKRMCIAALWCVQFTPENRPCMSTVVNILKGEIEATIPPNPFEHSYFTEFYSSTGTSGSSDSTRSGGIMDTNNQSFTSITDNYGVEMASSSENSIMVA